VAFYGLWPGMTSLELWLKIADEHEEPWVVARIGECCRWKCAGCGQYGWVQMDCPPQCFADEFSPLNFSNFSIAKLVVNKIVRVKITLSRLTTNTELISNIWFLKTIKTSNNKNMGFWYSKKMTQKIVNSVIVNRSIPLLFLNKILHWLSRDYC